MKKVTIFFFFTFIVVQISGSYIHKIANCTLSTATTICESPFIGYGSFFGFGLLERSILSSAPNFFITETNKKTYNHKTLANSRLLAAVQLTMFLFSASFYYKDIHSKSKLINGFRIVGDMLALCNIIISFDYIYHFPKK
jgi:hypothetical protein